MSDDTIIMDEEVIKDLREALNKKFNIMLEYFIEDSATYMSKIKEGIKDNNVKKIISASHPLKSSSRQVGAMLLGKLSEYIELRSRELEETGGSLAELNENVIELEAVLEKTLVEYKKILI